MLQQVVDFFKIPVHFTLDVMEPNQQLAGLTAKLLTRINELLVAEKPDFIIHVMAERFVTSYGDTLPITINMS